MATVNGTSGYWGDTFVNTVFPTFAQPGTPPSGDWWTTRVGNSTSTLTYNLTINTPGGFTLTLSNIVYDPSSGLPTSATLTIQTPANGDSLYSLARRASFATMFNGVLCYVTPIHSEYDIPVTQFGVPAGYNGFLQDIGIFQPVVSSSSSSSASSASSGSSGSGSSGSSGSGSSGSSGSGSSGSGGSGSSGSTGPPCDFKLILAPLETQGNCVQTIGVSWAEAVSGPCSPDMTFTVFRRVYPSATFSSIVTTPNNFYTDSDPTLPFNTQISYYILGFPSGAFSNVRSTSIGCTGSSSGSSQSSCACCAWTPVAEPNCAGWSPVPAPCGC